jgi:hypothetical protein
MHDIAVRDHDFGVWRLWEEIKATFKTSEFAFGYGLGVVYVDGARESQNEELRQLLSLKTTQTLFGRLGRGVLLEGEKVSLEKALNGKGASDASLRDLISRHERLRTLLDLPHELYAQISVDRGDGYEELLTSRVALTSSAVELRYVPSCPLEGARGVFLMPVNAPARLSSVVFTVVGTDGTETVLRSDDCEGLKERAEGMLESGSDFPRMFFTKSLPPRIREIRARYQLVLIGQKLVRQLQAEASKGMAPNGGFSLHDKSLGKCISTTQRSLNWLCATPLRRVKSRLSSEASVDDGGSDTKPNSPKT